MSFQRALICTILPLFLYSCRSTQPLASVKHDEAPFVMLKTGKKVDTMLAPKGGDGDYVDLRKGSSAAFGGAKNIAVYSDGTYRYGNVNNRFYPQVMEGKLDVYQTYKWESTDVPNTNRSISHKYYGYSFAKAGKADIRKANYHNLKPILASNSSLRSELSSFNIVDKTTIGTKYLGFAGVIAGAVILFQTASASSSGDINTANLASGAGLFAGGFLMYTVSHYVNRGNKRKVQTILKKYNGVR
jgi:hypothetical protein